MFIHRLHLEKGSPGREAAKLAGVQMTFWIAWVMTSYQTIFLKEEGFSAAAVGLVNALMSAVAIAAMTFWGMVSDKIHSVRKVNMILLIVGFALYAVIPVLGGLPEAFLILVLFIPFSNFFKGSTTIFLDNLTVRSCNTKGMHYGVIRSSGSIAYAIMSLIVAANIGWLGAENTFWVGALLMIIPTVLIFFCEEPGGSRRAKASKDNSLPVGLLFKDRQYMAFLVFTFVFYVAIGFEASFLPYYLDEMGFGSNNYGVLLAFRAFMEVPLLLGLSRLRRYFRMQYLIMIAAMLMALECFLFGTVVHSLPVCVLVCLLFGLGNGLYIGASPNYIYQLAPEQLKATAQAIYASVLSAAGIVGNLLGGVLFDGVGGCVFYRITGAVFVTAVGLFILSQLLGRSAKTKQVEQAEF